VAAIGSVQSIGGSACSTLGRDHVGPHTPDCAQDGASFADTLKNALGEVSELQTGAEDAMGAFLRGEPIEVHEVMAAAEEAGIALEMLIEIRNKLTEAYRTVSQMQS
jgi:flagellar hook-basal body complex protein FliE